MDLVLVSITALSLSLAAAMGVVVFRLLAEERQRSNARVALLQSAAAQVAHTDFAPAAEPGNLHLRDDVAVGDLFTEAAPEPLWCRRAGIAGALALSLLAGGVMLTWAGRTTDDAGKTTAAAAPLELVALTQSLQDGVLTVTGAVKNPRSGTTVPQVTATAVLFGPEGVPVASGQAALDYATLAPGDESQFVVAVPVKGAVSRYRVGFRTADGSVVAHVDRRSGAETVRNAARAGSTP
jgi:hypothetical protein